MHSQRIRNLRNTFDRNIVDKQVDKLLETGRQFVDGVSGARPGRRKYSDFKGITNKSVKKVGKWVSEKVDLFFDEENDDWYDNGNFYEDKSDFKSFTRESESMEPSRQYTKRPLEAVSLRPNNHHINKQKKLPYGEVNTSMAWPDDMEFKVDRWQRSQTKDITLVKDKDNSKRRDGLSKSKNLPRSRRRRA